MSNALCVTIRILFSVFFFLLHVFVFIFRHFQRSLLSLPVDLPPRSMYVWIVYNFVWSHAVSILHLCFWTKRTMASDNGCDGKTNQYHWRQAKIYLWIRLAQHNCLNGMFCRFATVFRLYNAVRCLCYEEWRYISRFLCVTHTASKFLQISCSETFSFVYWLCFERRRNALKVNSQL